MHSANVYKGSTLWCVWYLPGSSSYRALSSMLLLPRCITTIFSEPTHSQHRAGPSSSETTPVELPDTFSSFPSTSSSLRPLIMPCFRLRRTPVYLSINSLNATRIKSVHLLSNYPAIRPLGACHPARYTRHCVAFFTRLDADSLQRSYFWCYPRLTLILHLPRRTLSKKAYWLMASADRHANPRQRLRSHRRRHKTIIISDMFSRRVHIHTTRCTYFFPTTPSIASLLLSKSLLHAYRAVPIFLHGVSPHVALSSGAAPYNIKILASRRTFSSFFTWHSPQAYSVLGVPSHCTLIGVSSISCTSVSPVVLPKSTFLVPWRHFFAANFSAEPLYVCSHAAY